MSNLSTSSGLSSVTRSDLSNIDNNKLDDSSNEKIKDSDRKCRLEKQTKQSAVLPHWVVLTQPQVSAIYTKNESYQLNIN